MSDTPSCEHDEMEFSPRVSTIEQPVRFTFASINVRCSNCRELFHWRGVSSGQPNPNEPSVTADGFVLHAPLRPGPGAIVGLMQQTGVIDQLVDPNATVPADVR